jgi:hypothetical protein
VQDAELNRRPGDRMPGLEHVARIEREREVPERTRTAKELHLC